MNLKEILMGEWASQLQIDGDYDDLGYDMFIP